MFPASVSFGGEGLRANLLRAVALVEYGDHLANEGADLTVAIRGVTPRQM